MVVPMAGLIVNFCLITILIVCLCGLDTDAYVCKTNGTFGHCKLRENCPQLRNAKPISDEYNNKDCLKSEIIGDVVCCVKSPRIYTKEQKPKSLDLDQINTLGLSLLKKYDCGYITDGRIANGVNAALGEFPWMAMLLSAERIPFCGGSVITDRYILTAAHCITSDLHFVRLGEHNLATEEDCLPRKRFCRTYLDFAIDPEQKPIFHPKYKYSSKYKDIALIKINGIIDFERYTHIKPICLPTLETRSQLLQGDDLVLAGWGLQEDSHAADVLQKGMLKLDSLDYCKNVYKRYEVDESKLCVMASAQNAVSCRGDSGAPLFWKSKYESGNYTLKRYTQVGLVSLGSGLACGDSTSHPFLYENVRDSMPWITHTILN